MNSMLRIAIDGNEANVSNRVGSNVYAYELLLAMEKLTRSETETEITVMLSRAAIEDLPAERIGWKYKIITPEKLWTQFALPLHLFLHKNEYDVFFTPGHYAPRLASVPYVSSVMDAAYLRYPEHFKPKDLLQLKDWTEYSVKKARKVVAISESTKKDVIHFYDRKDQDVVIAYPSISMLEAKPSPIRMKAFLRKHKIKAPFICYVGTLQPRKNLIKLIDAYEKLCRRLASSSVRKNKNLRGGLNVHLPQLVLAGKVGWLADEALARIEQSPFRDSIILPGFVSDEQKYGLLEQAECSVLVGMYEGFGIPPLESLAVGTLPVVANSSSLPEVVGKAGILVNADNVTSIAEGLFKALSLSPKDRVRYRREAKRQVEKFSWSKSAEVILNTLRVVAES